MHLKMTFFTKYGWVHYANAIALSFFALLLSDVLWPKIVEDPFVFFIGAVTLSAWLGGMGSGLLATLLSIILLDYFLLEPAQFPFSEPSDYIQLLVFGSVAFLISWIENQRHKSEQLLRQTRDELYTILNAVSDGITVQDENGNFHYANESAATHSGSSSVQSIIATPLSEVQQRYEVFDVNGDRLNYTDMPRFHAFRTGKKSSLTFRQHFLETGEDKWITLTTSPIKDETDQVRLVVNVFRDISERHKIEHLQRENTNFLRQLIDSLPLLIGVISTEGIVLEANELALDIANLEREDVIGKPFDMVYWWSYSPRIQDQIRMLIAQAMAGDPVRLDMKIRISTDEFRIVDFMISPMRDNNGNIVKLIPSAVDITDRKQREDQILLLTRKLKDEKHRLNNIISNMPGIVFESFGVLQDRHQDITFVNDYVEQMLGYSSEELEKNPRFFHDCIHPDDLQHAIDRMVQIYDSTKNGKVQFRLIARDGRVIYTETRISVITDIQNNPVGTCGIIMDITERKNSEQENAMLTRQLLLQTKRLKAIADNTPGIVFESRGKPEAERQSFDYLSAHIEEILGYSTAELLEQPNFWKTVIHPDDWEDALITTHRIYGARKPATMQFRAITKQGEVVHLETHVSYVNEEMNTEEATAYGVIMDVTERKRMEQQLMRYMQELHRSNEELEQFAYVASHDLQEPLRKIRSYLQLIERRYTDKLDEDGKEFIGYAVDGATRMRELINDLLTFSRVQLNLGEFEAVDLNNILTLVINALQLRIADTSAKIRYDELPVVNANERQMTQLFQNLVSNSLKYHQEDIDPVVHIGVKACKEEWCFSIQDNGIGIPPDQQDRIFAVFQRLHHRDAYSGNGIGLAICKRVVENHGGRIWVQSQPGEGAVFHFTLPSTDNTLEQTDETDRNYAGGR